MVLPGVLMGNKKFKPSAIHSASELLDKLALNYFS